MAQRFLSALISCLFVAFPLFPQQKVFSLEEAIALSLKGNPEILKAEREIDAARARTLQLAAPPNPDLSFSNEGIHPGAEASYREMSLGLHQLIEFPGKRGLRKAIGQRGERISEASLDRIRLLVVSRVKRAYWKAACSEMTVSQLDSVLDTLREYQKLAAIRFQAGEVASTDVLRGRLEEVRVRNELIEARRTLRRDQSELWLEMGAETPAAFPPLAPMSFTPYTKGVEELKSEAADRPSIRALRQELSLRETSIRLARKSFYPDLRLGLYYPSLKTSGWGFDLEVSLPLWRQSQTGALREAEALREQGVISLESTLRRITNRIESSYASVRASSDQLALIETSLLKDAADLLSAGIVNYQYGRIDSLNLFDIYRMNKESRLEYLRALLSYELALVELETAGEEPAE